MFVRPYGDLSTQSTVYLFVRWEVFTVVLLGYDTISTDNLLLKFQRNDLSQSSVQSNETALQMEAARSSEMWAKSYH